ncbi:MAG: NepR family anti-sigma factor [Pseudomonadota bacterium]
MSIDDDKGRRADAAAATTASPSAIEETVQVEIGVRLKAYYDTITREPVPDRFMELLGELDGVAVGEPRAAKAPDAETEDGDTPDGPARDGV